MQRLAALVRRPRLHLICSHGVLAPSSTTSAKLRAQVVPHHCGHPETAGHREDPHAPGIAGAGTATLTRPRSSAANGLTIPIYHRSGGSQSRATGIGCARGFSGPMDVARWQAVTLGRRPERRISAGLSTPDRLRPASKGGFKRFGRCVPPLFCRAPGCRRTGERAFENPVLPDYLWAIRGRFGRLTRVAHRGGRSVRRMRRPTAAVDNSALHDGAGRRYGTRLAGATSVLCLRVNSMRARQPLRARSGQACDRWRPASLVPLR